MSTYPHYNGPRSLTPESIEGIIARTEFLTTSAAPRLTLCVLVLANGYTVTGESSCVDEANFDRAKGQKLARENAISKVWQLEGYRLREAMYESDTVDLAVGGTA